MTIPKRPTQQDVRIWISGSQGCEDGARTGHDGAPVAESLPQVPALGRVS